MRKVPANLKSNGMNACLLQGRQQKSKTEEEIEEQKEQAVQEEQQHKQLTQVDTLVLERNHREHYARSSNPDSEESNPANHVPSSGIANVVRNSTAVHPQQNGTPSTSAPGGAEDAGHSNGPSRNTDGQQQQPKQQQQQQDPPDCSMVSNGVGHTAYLWHQP